MHCGARHKLIASFILRRDAIMSRSCVGRIFFSKFATAPNVQSEPSEVKADPASIPPQSDEDFRKLELIPRKALEADKRVFVDRSKLEIMAPRSTRMDPDTTEWPDVWPTAASFKASAVPLPVRMGYQKHWRRKVPPPSKYGNLELMKIPNFLHLTPKAIERQCEAIKQFCTEWPSGLDSDEKALQHYPLQFTHSDYVHAGNSLRDWRARIVVLKVKVASLGLDARGRDKLIRLVGPDRYDQHADSIILTSDICPARHQNKDYTKYLLTALVDASRTKEAWEDDMTEADRNEFVWADSKSKQTALDIVRRLKSAYENAKGESLTGSKDANDVSSTFPSYLEMLSEEQLSDSSAESLPEVKAYSDACVALRNGETVTTLAAYDNSVRRLLGVPTLV